MWILLALLVTTQSHTIERRIALIEEGLTNLTNEGLEKSKELEKVEVAKLTQQTTDQLKISVQGQEVRLQEVEGLVQEYRETVKLLERELVTCKTVSQSTQLVLQEVLGKVGEGKLFINSTQVTYAVLSSVYHQTTTESRDHHKALNAFDSEIWSTFAHSTYEERPWLMAFLSQEYMIVEAVISGDYRHPQETERDRLDPNDTHAQSTDFGQGEDRFELYAVNTTAGLDTLCNTYSKDITDIQYRRNVGCGKRGNAVRLVKFRTDDSKTYLVVYDFKINVLV